MTRLLSRGKARLVDGGCRQGLAISLGSPCPPPRPLRHHPAVAAGWWLWGAGASSLLTVALTHIAPVVIDPSSSGIGLSAIKRCASAWSILPGEPGCRVVGVFEAEYSRKTTKANAYLTGVGSTRRIVLTDTLLQGYTHDEIAVVLAHELGHHHFGHLRAGIVLGAWARWSVSPSRTAC